MPRYAVKEHITLTVVTYVETEDAALAQDLVSSMDLLDYDDILGSMSEIVSVDLIEEDF
jgi:hypothetical protein